MKVACTNLHRTLDPGKHKEHIQFSTARKIRHAYWNVYHALQMMKEVSVMAFKTNKMYETSCSTYGYWFERFILGCHKRMGDIVVSDYVPRLFIWSSCFNWRRTGRRHTLMRRRTR
jgi:hypothetical protein